VSQAASEPRTVVVSLPVPRAIPEHERAAWRIVVGEAEIAKRLALSAHRVSQLTRGQDFPLPVEHLSMGDLWLVLDVEEWIAQHHG
jgi:hypothetical protein